MTELGPMEMRERIRAGDWWGPTAGCCPDLAQANLVVVPKALWPTTSSSSVNAIPSPAHCCS